MEYVQTTIEGNKLTPILNLPLSFLSGKVEVIIRPVSEKATTKKGSAFGCLKKYADASLIQEEAGVWEQAVLEKYANR